MAIWSAFMAGILALVSSLGGLLSRPTVMQSAAPQEAYILHLSLDTLPRESPTSSGATTIPIIEPGLLPEIVISHFKKSPTPLAATALKAAPPAPSPKPQTSLSAASLLAATTLSFHERLDGPFGITFTTNAGTPFTWDLSTSTIGGGSIPPLSLAYSCTPAPIAPEVSDPNQNPIFTAHQSYDCAVSLTPTSGTDLRPQSKHFSFTVPSGKLIVTPPQSMNTVLKNNRNDGGFVFTNNDTEPITITSLTLNVSYADLTTVYGPLVMRTLDPETGAITGEYDLTSIPADPSRPYAFAKNGIVAPVNVTIPPGGSRIIPIQLVGVDAMSMEHTTPTFSISLAAVATNRTDAAITLTNAALQWSCVVTFQAYDPNATSGPLATGQACNAGGN